MARIIERVDRGINTVVWNIAIVFLGMMLLIVMFQVVARYLFQAPPPWTAEAARYCMIWGGMLGATVAFYQGRDPRLFDPPRHPRLWIRLPALVLRGVAVGLFLGPVLFFARRFLERSANRTTEVLGIPAVWVTAAVPTAAVIIVIHEIVKIVTLHELQQERQNESTEKTGATEE